MRAFLIVTTLVLGACNDVTTVDPGSSVAEPAAKPAKADATKADADKADAEPGGALLTEKVKLKGNSGNEVAVFKPKDDGAKLVDPAGDELARYNAKGGKIKIKDAADKILGYVKGNKDKLKLLAGDGETERYALKRYDDGGLKLKTADGTLVYQLKAKDYGLKVVDDKEQLVFKVKKKGDKTSIIDAKDATIYSTKSAVSLAAFACLGFEKLTLPERGGLFLGAQRASDD